MLLRRRSKDVSYAALVASAMHAFPDGGQALHPACAAAISAPLLLDFAASIAPSPLVAGRVPSCLIDRYLDCGLGILLLDQAVLDVITYQVIVCRCACVHRNFISTTA